MAGEAVSTPGTMRGEIHYEVVRLQPEVRQAFLDLLPDQSAVNQAGKLAWKFDRHPFGSGYIAVARSDGRIVGMNAFIASRIAAGGTDIPAYQSLDTVVHPDWRGRGIFTRLVRIFADSPVKDPCEMIWGFPNANSAPGFFGKLGWRQLGQVPFLIKPLRGRYFLRKFGLPLDFPLSRVRDENAPTLARFDDDANELWSGFSRDLGCAVVRTADFLNWRLFGWAAADYRVAAWKSSRLEAFVATCVADKHGGRIGYVMEAMGGRELAGLLRSELGRLRSQGVELALAWCFPWSPNYPAYRAAGFLPLPERLRPIRINFGARSDTPRTEVATSARSWYLSYLDSDTV